MARALRGAVLRRGSGVSDGAGSVSVRDGHVPPVEGGLAALEIVMSNAFRILP